MKVGETSTLLRVAVATLLAVFAVFGAQACEPVGGVPAQIENGVYCMTFDIGISGGIALTVGEDAVLDCAGHSIIDLGSSYTAISVQGSNVVIRNCIVEGFENGITVSSGADYYRVVGNTIRSPRTKAILAFGGDGAITGNVVSSSGIDGGHQWLIDAYGLADIQGNVILSAEAPATSTYGARYGIRTHSSAGGVVARNVLRNILPSYGNQGIAIHASGGYPVLYRNVMNAVPGRGDIGMFCYGGTALSKLNTVVGYPHEVGDC